MILITSGAYIADEFASEIGRLPPAFLPVGNRRLYQFQYELLSALGKPIYLSIPEDYRVEPADSACLAALDIKLIRVPSGLSLGNSILFCWNATGEPFSQLTLLHGDTLFADLALEESDLLTLHSNKGFYQRARLTSQALLANHFEDIWAGADEKVVSGFFSFCKPHILMQGIVQRNGSFIAALEHYANQQDLKPLEGGKWYDFGHLNSFFRSRSEITTQRAFNEMSISSRVVGKASQNHVKMAAEANWFLKLPAELKIHIPSLLTTTESAGKIVGYQLEYLYLLPLSDLFVFGNLNPAAWRQIFNAVNLTLKSFWEHSLKPNSIDTASLNQLYFPKTLERLEQYSQQSGCDLNHPLVDSNNPSAPMSLLQLAEISAQFIAPANINHHTISHGDFCFSNILYDTRVQCLKLIDPRGLDVAGTQSIFGDRRYDLAKLYHSVVGLYDLIIAGHFTYSKAQDSAEFTFNLLTSPQQEQIEQLFLDMVVSASGISHKEILAINIHLFLSMLPLHYDRPDRQAAMIANTHRLYQKLVNL